MTECANGETKTGYNEFKLILNFTLKWHKTFWFWLWGQIFRNRGFKFLWGGFIHKHFSYLYHSTHEKEKGIWRNPISPNTFISAVLHLFCFSSLHQLSEFYFVSVFKNHPVLRGMVNCLLVFVGVLMRTEVDCMPHILRFGQYPSKLFLL